MMQESLVEVQTRLAFMEDTVNTLNDVVSAHEQTIERLERALRAVEEQLAGLANGEPGAEDAPPPHY